MTIEEVVEAPPTLDLFECRDALQDRPPDPEINVRLAYAVALAITVLALAKMPALPPAPAKKSEKLTSSANAKTFSMVSVLPRKSWSMLSVRVPASSAVLMCT